MNKNTILKLTLTSTALVFTTLITTKVVHSSVLTKLTTKLTRTNAFRSPTKNFTTTTTKFDRTSPTRKPIRIPNQNQTTTKLSTGLSNRNEFPRNAIRLPYMGGKIITESLKIKLDK